MKSAKRKRRDFASCAIKIGIQLMIIYAALFAFCGFASLILRVCGVG